MWLLGKGYEIAFWDVFVSLRKEYCLILRKTGEDFFVVFLILYLYLVFLLEVIFVIDCLELFQELIKAIFFFFGVFIVGY